MGTIEDKLNRLIDTKAAIKTAIISKGQNVSDSDPFASYAERCFTTADRNLRDFQIAEYLSNL